MNNVKQYIIYGYLTNIKTYRTLADNPFEVAEHDGDIGWITDHRKDMAILGKIMNEGDDDNLLASENGVLNIEELSQAERGDVEIKVLETFPSDEHNDCRYYLVSIET